MRSLLLVIVTAIGLAGLFVLYWTMQPAAQATRAAATTRPAPPAPRRADDDERRLKEFHSGDLIWMKQYNVKGELASAFTGEHYQPQKDGTIQVTRPVAAFFLENHQRLEITGVDGNMVIKDPPELGKPGFGDKGPAAPPQRGRLNDVKMILYDETDPKNPAVVLTLVTNNIAFDNETFLIYTEAYKDGDREIPADQVPVDVIGNEKTYDFHGRGLMVRWNDKDGRLELLEIAHGDTMIIKDASSLSGPSAMSGKKAGRKSRRENPASAPVTGAVSLLPNPILQPPVPSMLVANDKAAANELAQSKPTSRPRRTAATQPKVPAPAVVYLATFYDNVQILQGEQLAITANRLDANFVMKPDKGKGPATAPTAATTEPAPATLPDTEPTSQPASQPTSVPASQPADAGKKPDPIVIHWTGILRIAPQKTPTPVPLAQGDAIMRLTGSPVLLKRMEAGQQGMTEMRCGTLVYQTNGGKALLDRSDEVPQVIVTRYPAKDAKNQGATRIVSEAIHYASAEAAVDHLAKVTAYGNGHAEFPLDPEAGDDHPVLNASWVEGADLYFAGKGEDEMVIDHAMLVGNVDVQHPRLLMKSRVLELFFSPPAPGPSTAPTSRPAPATQPGDAPKSQAELRRVLATDSVFCRMKPTNKEFGAQPQTVECDRLDLHTDKSPEGKLYARQVDATGHVHAYADDDVRAGEVFITLHPAKPSMRHKESDPSKTSDNPGFDTADVQLEKLIARKGVVASGKDGSVAICETLQVTAEDGKQHILLKGLGSETLATVSDPKLNIISGPTIQVEPADNQAHVIGAGNLHIERSEDATVDGKEARKDDKQGGGAHPMDVAWTDRADLDGPADRIDVRGKVVAQMPDPDGRLNVATGDHMRIDLRKKRLAPTTAPARLAKADVPAAQTRPAAAGQMELFKDKEVATITIEQQAVVTSTLAAANGGILQQFEIKAPLIRFLPLDEKGLPSNRLVIPSPGKMLVRDHRPAGAQAAAENAGSIGGARGATAFQWTRGLDYSEADRRAVMSGDVLVVHQEDDGKQQPLRLNADTVTAFFEPATPTQKPPTTRPATAPHQSAGPARPAMELKSIHAEGNVVVTHEGSQMDARSLDMDPHAHTITAHGTPRNPVVFSDPRGSADSTAAEEVTWDTVTWNPKFKNIVTKMQLPGATSEPKAKKR